MVIYRRIRDLREDHDLRQRELAELLNCTQACYSYYESGRLEIPIEALSQLADFYNTSIDYLVGRTDDPRPYPKRKSP